MNFEALTGLGTQATAKSDWHSTAEHFLTGVRTNALVKYPIWSSCDIPDDMLMNVADMQLELRRMVESAMRYADGTTFQRYCNGMRGTDTMRFNAELPASPQLYLPEKRLMQHLDGAAESLELPGKTRSWYRTQYGAVLRQAERLSEFGRQYAGKEEALFSELTGAAPTGRVRAMFTPRSIHFRCEKKEDVARLIYPDERTASLQERRDEACTSRGMQTVCKLPASMGGHNVSLTVENFEVTAGADSFGTFDHEQEHAMNAFAKHPSTSLGKPPKGEMPIEFCARTGVSETVKEEFIAWSLRPHIHLPSLFLGSTATYHPVKTRLRQMREAKVDASLMDPFSREAGNHLSLLVPPAADAVNLLMQRYPRTLVREMLRTKPVHEWAVIAADWSS